MRLRLGPLALIALGASAAPTIGTVDINPKSFPLAVPSVVTITAVITDTSLIDGGAILQRIDSSGRVIATYGILYDDGKNGDAVAGDRIFTVQQSFTEGTVGPIQLRVAAAFKGVLTRVFSGILTVNVTGTAAPKITILSPQNLAYLNTASTTVTGTVDIANATVKVNEVNAPLSGKNFSVALPLAEGPNIITVTAQAPGAPVASSSISVNLDTTAPRVTITSPPDQFQTADAAISVAGVVNDIVVGTVNAEQVTVTVNGQNAQVSNRTFGINSVALAAGANTITATGRDRAGNTFTTSVNVTRIIPPPVRLSLVSGNNQSGRIGTALPQPLVVSLLQGTTPLQNKQVIFKITQNNGQLSVGANPPAASVAATTDSQGRAQAVLTLGTRSGAGGNQVEAYAVGYDGSALFTETGVPANAALIVVDSGNAQTGEVNQKLAKPFIAVVTDAGFNRLANVPVTFTVKSGGGGIDGKAAITVNTDSDGRAAAVLTLGFQEGTASNQVEANFPGNTSYPAVFTATGKLTADPTKTSISGVVLDNSNNPLPGVTLRTVLTNQLTMNSSIVNAAAVTTTDAQGQFKLQPAPVGFVKLLVDGSTTAKPGKYPSLDYDLVTVAGQNTTVGQPIYLLPIKEDNKLCLTPTTGGGTLTIPEAPGFSLTLKAGQVTFPGGTQTGCVSVTVVHSDKVPMVPGFGQQPRFVVTIQPAGALFNPPAPITLPNVDGLKPGAMTEMYSFDHDIGSFVAIGTGQVSDDGLIIRSSTGVGVLKAGWHCGGDPQARGHVADCAPCKFCEGPSANQLGCVANPGAIGQSCAPSNNPCVSGTCGGTLGTGNNPNLPTGSCDVSYIAGPCTLPGGLSGTCQGGACIGQGNQCPTACNGGQCVNGVCVNNACQGRNSGPCSMGGGVVGQCQNGQCVGSGNQCPAYCNGTSCLNGICTQNCNGSNNGAACNAGGSVPGVCIAGACEGQGNQCQNGCAACTNGSCGCTQNLTITPPSGPVSLLSTGSLTPAIVGSPSQASYDWQISLSDNRFGLQCKLDCKETTSTGTWSPTFGNGSLACTSSPGSFTLLGGSGSISASACQQTQSVPVTVAGSTLDIKTEVQAELTRLGGDDFLKRIACFESHECGGQCQFLNGLPLIAKNKSGVDTAVGVMQITTNAHFGLRCADIWDWKANVANGVATYQEKIATVEGDPARELARINSLRGSLKLLACPSTFKIPALSKTLLDYDVGEAPVSQFMRQVIRRYEGGTEYVWEMTNPTVSCDGSWRRKRTDEYSAFQTPLYVRAVLFQSPTCPTYNTSFK